MDCFTSHEPLDLKVIIHTQYLFTQLQSEKKNSIKPSRLEEDQQHS